MRTLFLQITESYNIVGPTGIIISNETDRPALFAAQFALSHGCWLITYPAAGWIGAELGLNAAYIVLAIITTVAVTLVSLLWKGDHEK
ncbi:hypothetical protein [Advenella incenata]|jgi:hypothetical protein|uniref:hypothetical protein n=1 Tax=Advenella incenata TaxID=267800 RepID=UPI0013EE854A|nr:hypothetical protein [Advenella incenata]